MCPVVLLLEINGITDAASLRLVGSLFCPPVLLLRGTNRPTDAFFSVYLVLCLCVRSRVKFWSFLPCVCEGDTQTNTHTHTLLFCGPCVVAQLTGYGGGQSDGVLSHSLFVCHGEVNKQNKQINRLFLRVCSAVQSVRRLCSNFALFGLWK